MPIGERATLARLTAAAGSVSKSTTELGSETIVLRQSPETARSYMWEHHSVPRSLNHGDAARFRAVETNRLINPAMRDGKRRSTSARQFYERAADAGDGRAALENGRNYDPTFLTPKPI